MPEYDAAIDGDLRRLSEKEFSRLIPGQLRADGVFETLHVYDGIPFALEDHLRRLVKGLGVLHRKLPLPRKEIRKACLDLCRRCRRRHARLRVLCWFSGKAVRWAVTIKGERGVSRSVYRRGMSAVTYDVGKADIVSSPWVKSLDRRFYAKAYRFAQRKGCDEALLFDPVGALREGSYSNVFLVQSGQLITPSLSVKCLSGVTRSGVLRIARLEHISVRQRGNISLKDVFNADEVFLTSSWMGVMPLTMVDEKTIADGRPGILTQHISEAYKSLVQCASIAAGGKKVYKS